MRINIVNQGGYGNGGFDIAGATLTGPLILAADPTTGLEAATKQYVDNAVNSLNAGHITTGILPVGRLPAFTGDLTSTAGSNSLTLSNSGVIAGTYTKVTVDVKGRITNGLALTVADIPDLSWNKITTGKPTTLAGFGITDGVKNTTDSVTGYLTAHAAPTNATHAATKAYVDSLSSGSGSLSVGDTIRRPSSVTPTGFLRCNGGQFSKTTYPALYSVLSSMYSSYANIDYTSYAAMGNGQPWRQQFGFKTSDVTDITGWSIHGTLPTEAMDDGQVIVTKNRVYILGKNAKATVLTAPINADGTLGTWTTGTNLPVILFKSQVVVTKNRVYLLGGKTSATMLTSTVYTAPINTDGTLGTWSASPNSLPGNLAQSQAVVTKNRVYLLGGGVSTSNRTANIYYAPINSDGTLGVWSSEGSLPTSLMDSHAVVTKNRVYLLGGNNGSIISTIYTAPIFDDGVIGSWSVASSSLPGPLADSQVIVTKNRVFTLGGRDGSDRHSNVYTAPINADGTLGSWTTGTPLHSTLANSQAIVTKNRVYLLSGLDASGLGSTTNIYTALLPGNESFNDYSNFYNGTINKFDGSDISGTILLKDGYSDSLDYTQSGNGQPWRQQYQINTQQSGDITNWAFSDYPLPATITESHSIVTKNRIYLLGGSINSAYSSTGYTATINADGTLNSWNSISLPASFSYSQAIVTKNRVYLLGGNVNGSYSTSVYTAPINSDGTLGEWTTGTSLPLTIVFSHALVTKNRAYLLGGEINGANSSAVYTAPIDANGMLGSWTNTNNNLPAFVKRSQLVVTKNRVYLIGGLVNGSNSSNVYTAPINSDGTLGVWATASNLPVSLYGCQSIVTQNKVYLLGGYANGSYSSTVYTAPINADGTLGNWTTGTSLPGSTMLSQAVVVKNKIYLIGGNNGSNLATIHVAPILGGLNDYSPYYNGTIIPVESGNFKLPDTTLTDPVGIYTFIKY